METIPNEDRQEKKTLKMNRAKNSGQTQGKKKKKNKRKMKMNRAAMTWGAIPGGLVDMPSDSKTVSRQKIFEVISAKIFPNLIITTIPQIQSPSK